MGMLIALLFMFMPAYAQDEQKEPSNILIGLFAGEPPKEYFAGYDVFLGPVNVRFCTTGASYASELGNFFLYNCLEEFKNDVKQFCSSKGAKFSAIINFRVSQSNVIIDGGRAFGHSFVIWGDMLCLNPK